MSKVLQSLSIAIFLAGLLESGLAEDTVGYRIVHPDGTVEFTDDANSGGKEVQLRDLQNVGSPGPSSDDEEDSPRRYTSTSRAREANQPAYSVLRILSPEAEQTYWYSDGRLGIRLKLYPDLKPGHTIQYSVDGSPVGLAPETGLTYEGPVYRGTHTVTAAVVDGHGKVLISASPVTFYVKQRGK